MTGDGLFDAPDPVPRPKRPRKPGKPRKPRKPKPEQTTVSARPDPIRLAEAVWNEWHGGGAPGTADDCTGVIAALCLLVSPGEGDPDMWGGDLTAVEACEKLILEAGDDELFGLLGKAWGWFWAVRPDLCRLCGPLANFTQAEDPDPHLVRAAARVARKAVRLGLFRCTWVDILGMVYTEGRSKSARSGLGEYYTPHNVCWMMAQLQLGSGKDALPKGASIAEPAAGTGGMILGMIHAMHEQGLNPADYCWYANDIAPLAVACLAVNLHVWRAGPNVLVAVANSLAELDWPKRAVEETRAVLAHHDTAWKMARMLAVLNPPPPVPDPPPEPQPEPEPQSTTLF